MQSKLFITVLTSFFLTTMSYAGDAGCGLGGLIIQKNSKILQLLAVTTNHSFLSQEFGITFGTSGCSASGLVMNEKKMQYYVEVNQQDLNREMAQGYGTKLDTLAVLNGCYSDDAINSFESFAQRSLTEIMPSARTSSVEFVSRLRNEVRKDQGLQSLCHGS
jgi:hypothetical protein